VGDEPEEVEVVISGLLRGPLYAGETSPLKPIAGSRHQILIRALLDNGS
jgi:hypothetical protein